MNRTLRGKKIVRDFIVVRAVPNLLKKTRIGIIVSKKVSLKAVERNRLRRCVSEAVRLELPPPPLAGWDVVFVATPGLKGATCAAIRGTVKKLLSLLV